MNITRIAGKYVKQRVQEIDDHSKPIVEDSEEAPPKVDFLTYLMHSEALTMEEVIANIIDQIAGGVETVRTMKLGIYKLQCTLHVLSYRIMLVHGLLRFSILCNFNHTIIVVSRHSCVLICTPQTSLALSWCLYLLANNPEVHQKLREEVKSVLGSDRVVTPDHINHMPYLRNCIKETLRLIVYWVCSSKV